MPISSEPGGRPLKVAHVELGGRIVGGPQQVLYLLQGLKAAGVDNVLVAAAGGPLAARVSESGHARVVPMRWSGDTDLSLLFRLWDLLRRERPDVLHLHAGPDAVLGGVAARLAGVPSVLSRRVDNAPRSPFSRWTYSRLFDRVICISEAILEVLQRAGVDPSRLELVRSSVVADDWVRPASLAAFHAAFGLPQDALTLGVVAQLVPRKGHRVLFEALALGVPPEVRVICFGEGRLQAELQAEVEARGLGDIVQFAGHRNDLPEWMAQLDLVVHPALTEGLGVALLQAASAGVPVLASAADGMIEAVADGETGMLVPPGDAAALHRALLQLLAEPKLRSRYGAAGRARMLREFDVARMVERHIAIYRALSGRD